MELQRIFDKYEAWIDEFTSDLHMFATGGYLAEDEGENWMQPFGTDRIPEVGKALKTFLSVAVANPIDPVLASSDVSSLYQQLDEINEQEFDPVIEQEEFEDIEGMLRDFYEDMGMSDEEISTIPTYQDWVESVEDEE